MEKIEAWVHRNIRRFTIVWFFVFFLGTCYLITKWCVGANTFGDNLLIEFFVGGLFFTLPLILTEVILKGRERQVYLKIIPIIKRLKHHREGGTLSEEATRDLVIEVSNSIDKEILEKAWTEEVIMTHWVKEGTKCEVCLLRVDKVNDKCEHCKLSCFAWENLT
ncbi:MAG: hypothetical protein JWQ09_881 [Segetibacter sp.]|nr:hypothetical protein [Segetibacter sp.]